MSDVELSKKTENGEEEAQAHGNEAQENGAPSREEILAVSREENKKGDEREQQGFAKAGTLAFSAGLFAAGIIILVDTFVSGTFPAEVFLIVALMQAVQNILVAVFNSRLRKIYLILGVLEAVCAAAFIVMWILQLCGRMV